MFVSGVCLTRSHESFLTDAREALLIPTIIAGLD